MLALGVQVKHDGSKRDLAREAEVKIFASLCLYWNQKTVSFMMSEGILMDFCFLFEEVH